MNSTREERRELEGEIAMAGKYTEFEKQPDGNLRIVLREEAREDVQDIASSELDADSQLAEVIEWQMAGPCYGQRT
jgi:hypothetical protein